MPLKAEGIARHESLLFIVCLFIYLFSCDTQWVGYLGGITGEKRPTVGGVSKDGKLAEWNASLCGHFVFF
jgi:hypothetical protein